MFFSSFQTKLLQAQCATYAGFELSVRTMGCANSKGESKSSLDGRADIGAVVPAAAKLLPHGGRLGEKRISPTATAVSKGGCAAVAVGEIPARRRRST